MSEWITDRRPTAEDVAMPHGCVYDGQGHIVHHALIIEGEPWKLIPKCEPYVKLKRWHIESTGDDMYLCHPLRGCMHLMNMVTSISRHKEAAIRIAAIYEEVMP